MTLQEQIKKAIEKEFPGKEVKSVTILVKKDDTHYWVSWEGVEHDSFFGDIQTFMPMWEVTIKE